MGMSVSYCKIDILRSNRSFESLKGVTGFKMPNKENSPQNLSREGFFNKGIHSPTSGRASIASKDNKMMSARPYIQESSSAININLPLKKPTSDPNFFQDSFKFDSQADGNDSPDRIGALLSESLNHSQSDLCSHMSHQKSKQSLKQKSPVQSFDKQAGKIIKHTDSKQKLVTDLHLVLEKHRKSEVGKTGKKHERLNSGISHKDTPRVGLNLEDSMDCYIEAIKLQNKTSEEKQQQPESMNPFSLTQGLKKKPKKGIAAADRKLNESTASKSNLNEKKKKIVKSGDFTLGKKSGGMHIDLYKEEGQKKYLMPSFKNNKEYDDLLKDRKNNSQNMNSSNPSSRRKCAKSKERSTSRNSLQSMSLHFSSSTKKPAVKAPSYSSSIYT